MLHFNINNNNHNHSYKYMLFRAQYGGHSHYGLICCAFLHFWEIGCIFQRAFGLKERAPPKRAYYIRNILLEKLT